MRPVLLTLCLALLATLACAGAESAKTATGISLDAVEGAAVYVRSFAFRASGLGWQHSERNYQIGLRLAKGDNMHIDTDVLFAAAFLHDMAAFQPWRTEK